MKKGENKGIHKKIEGESEKRKNKEIHQERRKKDGKKRKRINT